MHATRTTSEAETDLETESNTGFLPDQLINPGEYEPLLPTTEEHYTQLLNPQKKTESRSMKNRKDCMMPVYTYGSIN